MTRTPPAKKSAHPAKKVPRVTICTNRRAKFVLAVEQEIEAGVVLSGTEVKALRAGRATLTEAFVQVVRGEAVLLNANVAEYSHGNRFNHDPTRSRKLLLHRREIDKLAVRLGVEGYTAVPLALYFNEDGRVKLNFGVGRGKSHADKRQDIKAKDAARDVARALRRGAR